MKIPVKCLLLCVGVLGLAATSNAALITTSNFNPTLNGSGTFTLGNLIQIGATPISINALGVQDTGADGIVANTAVGIWNSDITGTPGTQVATATVPSGTSAVLLNDYRYVQLGSPITLTAGSYYIIGARSATNGTAENAGDGFPGSIYSGDTGVTVLDSRFTAGAALTAPATVGGSGATVGRWGPANAATVPEPTMSAALLLGGTLLSFKRARKACR